MDLKDLFQDFNVHDVNVNTTWEDPFGVVKFGTMQEAEAASFHFNGFDWDGKLSCQLFYFVTLKNAPHPVGAAHFCYQASALQRT